MKVNWMIWPLVTSVNLYFVPPIYRVLCVNFFALWWNLYLSVLNSKSSVIQEETKPAI